MKDSVREAWLNDNGWEFDYEPKVPIDQILIDKSAQQQVRLGEQVDEQLVTRYLQALKAGAQFPAIILIQPENGGPLPIGDGIHRTTAMRKAGQRETDAYVVTNASTAKMTELLRRTANAPGGKGFDTSHAILQALALVDAGWNTAEAAKLMHVNVSSVQLRVRAREAAKRVAKVMAPMTAARVMQVVPVQTLDALARIRRTNLFETATQVAMRGKLTTTQVDQLSQEASQAVTDRESEDLLAAWQKTYAPELASTILRGDAAVKQLRNAPKVRLDRAIVTLKGALTTIRNHVDGRKLDVESKKYAAETLRWASGELTKMARRIYEGKSASRD